MEEEETEEKNGGQCELQQVFFSLLIFFYNSQKNYGELVDVEFNF